MSILALSNPYFNTTFFSFLYQFVLRFVELITGRLSLSDLASDEIQIYVLSGVAISGALVGSFLVLRRMTMMANAISHTILLGIVLAYVFLREFSSSDAHQIITVESLLIAALIMGVVTAFLTEFLTKTIKLQEDASTGLVFTTLFALGIIFVTLLTKDTHIGIEAVLGNVDALHVDDLKLVWGIVLLNLILIMSFFKEYTLTTFDPTLARALGFSTLFFNYLLMTQFSATAVVSFRAVGVLMVLAFITGPPLTARLMTDNLKRMILYAVGIGIVVSVVGVAFSRHILTTTGLPLSTAGLVVTILSLVYVVVICVRRRWVYSTQRPQSSEL
jgi:manganese/zinc/iron transport system permease protein